jgi:hypothetical protein
MDLKPLKNNHASRKNKSQNKKIATDIFIDLDILIPTTQKELII